VPVWNEGPNSGEGEQPSFGEQLSTEQRTEFEALLEEYADGMQNQPGQTTLAEHHIRTGDAHPVELPPPTDCHMRTGRR